MASKLPNNVLVCILLLIKIKNSFIVLLFGCVYSYLSSIREYKIISCAGFVDLFLRWFVTIRLINSHKIKHILFLQSLPISDVVIVASV